MTATQADPLALLNPNAGTNAQNAAVSAWTTNTNNAANQPNPWMQGIGLGLQAYSAFNRPGASGMTFPSSGVGSGVYHQHRHRRTHYVLGSAPCSAPRANNGDSSALGSCSTLPHASAPATSATAHASPTPWRINPASSPCFVPSSSLVPLKWRPSHDPRRLPSYFPRPQLHRPGPRQCRTDGAPPGRP